MGSQGRSAFEPADIVRHIWQELGLPESHCNFALQGAGRQPLPSSFKIGHLAQATIATSALAAALVDAFRNDSEAKRVTVPLDHAALEFETEKHHSLDGGETPSGWGPLSGLYASVDGYVRVHDGFPNLRLAACSILGVDVETAARDDFTEKIKQWKSIDLEEAAAKNKAVIYALRSYREWDALPQAQAVPDFPISLRKISAGPNGFPDHMPKHADRCLRGLRVLDLTRVIAGPVAGKTLAVHGADVLWVTSPSLPNQPAIDIDVQRGKRTIRLDLDNQSDAETLRNLIKQADVFLQSYRPGSLAARGFSPQDLAKLRPGIICANLSAWGDEGPWANNRGFDSIVQTVSGMNVSEAEHYGVSPAKPMPAQALDHGAGYLLATGICAALYKRSLEGGSWEVNVSLVGVMKCLRSLGQYPGREGFDSATPMSQANIAGYLEEKQSGFGMLKAVKHSAQVEGKMPGWDIMPKPLGSDEARWLL